MLRLKCHCFAICISSYQIYFKRCLEGVVQVDHEGAFAQSKRVSFSLHLASHILVNHVGFLHHLRMRKESITIEKHADEKETV